jgi:type II secretory pathway pseudopilin PulG
MRRETGYTLVEMSVVTLVIATAMSLALAGLDQQGLSERKAESLRRLRGIHQQMVVFASDNKEWFPGVNEKGEVIEASASGVVQIMLDGNYFMGKHVISPMEQLEPGQKGQEVTTDNISYAILDFHGLDKKSDRFREWRSTINSSAAVLSDRNTGAEDGYASVWTPFADAVGWSGGVVRNDNSAIMEATPVVLNTRYGRGKVNAEDHLFESEGESDALMTFHKDGEGKEQPVAARLVPPAATQPAE